MNSSTIFFDLDDTLYPPSSGLWPLIKDRIGLFMTERLNIPLDQVGPLRKQLFDEYGTTLRGLQVTRSVDVQDYLAFVHAIRLEDYIQPDPVLTSVLSGLPARKFIFTNADVQHARRVLRVLQIEEFFEGIIDIVAITPYCKPMPPAFTIALQAAGDPDPRSCVMIDDLPHTTRMARQLGLFSILFGTAESQPGADANATLADWSKLPDILNGASNAY